jgi:hypothetical protein
MRPLAPRERPGRNQQCSQFLDPNSSLFTSQTSCELVDRAGKKPLKGHFKQLRRIRKIYNSRKKWKRGWGGGERERDLGHIVDVSGANMGVDDRCGALSGGRVYDRCCALSGCRSHQQEAASCRERVG